MRGPNAWRTPLIRLSAAGVLVLAALAGTAAMAAPPAPQFGPVIDGYAPYQGQTRCKPRPKPGVVGFRDMLLAAYPDSTWFTISRPCGVGGQSEHKEGRALDWARNAAVPTEKAQVQDLLGWLLATDQHGNRHAMARRLGVMYIMWNRRMWSAWEGGWEVYCVMRNGKCKDPETKAVLHPHRDHVHFSFSWRGARMETTFWHPEVSFGLPPAPSPSPTPTPAP